MCDAPEFFHQVESIFAKVLAAPGPLRAAVLEEICRGDEPLLREVRLLLRASELEEAQTASLAQTTAAERAEQHTGRRIGPYQIDRLVGHGGMGAVYLAHRADGEFEQQVAIKLIDLPLVSDFFQQQFRRERQILARPTHPNIAHLMDGGVTGDGELYLVMEYVDGEPLQQYCAAHTSTLRERIEIFLAICDAVQFAHQNLVVHRDLKPGNILVTAEGVPKLLDFGTAKLLSPGGGLDSSEFTRQGVLSFTPQYASPEQVLGHPITTSSDVYSLGVLLYLLVAGVAPYELKAFTTDEMIRTICLAPVPKPSSRAALFPVDSDLDAIVLKAMRKEPEERYSSVDRFMADLRAYLEGRPVAARQGTLRYLAAKFIRRNKVLVGAAALVCAVVLAGTVGVLWQARIADTERRMAEARADDLRKLSNQLLSEIDEAIQKLPGSTAAQKLLVGSVLEHLDRASHDAAADPQMQLDVANAYIRLGNVQGNPYEQNIGDVSGALASLGKARTLAEQILQKHPADTNARHALAWGQQSESEVLFGAGRPDEAVARMKRAIANFEDLASRPGASADTIYEAAGANGGLGDELGQSGINSLSDLNAAIAAYHRSLELAQRALQVSATNTRALRSIAVSNMKIASVEAETDPGAALEHYRAALQGMYALPAEARNTVANQRTLASIHRKYGMALKEAGRTSDALAEMDQGWTIIKQMYVADPRDARAANDLLAMTENQAECLEQRVEGGVGEVFPSRRQSAEAALAKLTEAREVTEAMIQMQPENAYWRSTLGYLLVRMSVQQRILGQARDAEGLAAKGAAMLQDLAHQKQLTDFDLSQIASGLATVQPARLRNPGLAVECAQQLVEHSHRKKATFFLTLSRACRSADQPESARAAAQEGLRLLPEPAGGRVPSYLYRQLEAEARK